MENWIDRLQLSHRHTLVCWMVEQGREIPAEVAILARWGRKFA